MGQCSSKKKAHSPIRPPPKRRPTSFQSEMPLRLQVSVRNLSLRGVESVRLTQDTYYLDLNWASVKKKTEKRTGSEVRWQSEWNFGVQSTPNALQTQEFAVSVWQVEGGKPVAVVRIPLWEVVVGPQNQSFRLASSKGKPLGRFECDIKVLQLTQFQMRASFFRAHFSTPQYGKFSLSVKYSNENHLEPKQTDTSDTPNWPSNKVKSVTFSIQATISTFRTNALHFRIWKQNAKGQTMLAECWLGLSRLLKPPNSQSGKGDSPPSTPDSYPDIQWPTSTDEAERPFEGTLWLCGRQMGVISGSFLVTGVPFVSQLRMGVNTEEGYKIQNTEFLQRQKDKGFRTFSVPEQMVQMEVLGRQLRECVKKNRECAVMTGGSQPHLTHATMLLYELKETERDTMIAHVYSNEAELLEAQNLLLNLGEFLLEFSECVTDEVRAIYYEGLSHLVKRGEIDLGHLSLDGSMTVEIRTQKQAVGSRYRNFLKKLLERALAKLSEKGRDQKIVEFSEVVISLCYFRITAFREKLLSVIKEKSFDQVPEWRGTTYDLEADVQSDPLPLLDWDRYLFSHLPKTETDIEFERVLNDSTWHKFLSKRGLIYFGFLSEWVSAAKRLFGKRLVPWHDIAGYHALVKTFLLELKSRPIREYPDALLKASLNLLSNPHLISVFLLILFQKTNVYDSESVREAIIDASNWMNSVYEAGTEMPVTFPSAFFVQGLRIALESEIMLNVCNVLYLLYRNFQCLNAEVRQEFVLTTIVGSDVKTLAFHWSHSVRTIFWMFLLYRIKSLKRLPLAPLTVTDEAIITEAESLIASLHDSSTKSSLAPEQSPYFDISRGEYAALLPQFETWLEEKQGEIVPGKKAKYGPFSAFPFPEVKVQKAFEDCIERKFAED